MQIKKTQFSLWLSSTGRLVGCDNCNEGPGRLWLLIRASLLVCLLVLPTSSLFADQPTTDTRPGTAPDIREDDTQLKMQHGDFVVVPIPISNPTLDTGLVAGAAYFYKQTDEQKRVQPASVTAVGGMYTSNDSKAFALGHQGYWKSNTWRFTGAIGAADLRLSLLGPDEASDGQSTDWRINGDFAFAKLSRRLAGNWYGGFSLRTVNAEQSFETSISTSGFDLGSEVRSAGLGGNIEFDTRDMPLNTYSGRYFKADALFNDDSLGSDNTYQSYSLELRSYHDVSDSLVLAWEVRGCKRGGATPLWDSCLVQLRGFSVTDYLGKETASGQLEARWRLSERWGLVGFAGAGYVGDSFGGVRESEPIPSYGAGVRFMVLAAKRINLRIDYAWSTDSDAIHIAVGETF